MGYLAWNSLRPNMLQQPAGAQGLVKKTTRISSATCFNCHSDNTHLKPVVQGRVLCCEPLYSLLPSLSLEYVQRKLTYPQCLHLPKWCRVNQFSEWLFYNYSNSKRSVVLRIIGDIL